MVRNAPLRNEALGTIANDPVDRAESPGQPQLGRTESEMLPLLVKDAPRTGSGIINELLFKLGIEPTLTVREAAAILRWSYWKTRRYFRKVQGICVCYQPKRYKREYRTFTIPLTVFAREWQKMTGQPPESAKLIHQRVLTLVK